MLNQLLYMVPHPSDIDEEKAPLLELPGPILQLCWTSINVEIIHEETVLRSWLLAQDDGVGDVIAAVLVVEVEGIDRLYSPPTEKHVREENLKREGEKD